MRVFLRARWKGRGGMGCLDRCMIDLPLYCASNLVAKLFCAVP